LTVCLITCTESTTDRH